MNIEILKRIIKENLEFINSLSLKPRHIEIEKEGNYVLIGQRRAGKTFILYQIIQSLSGKKNDDCLFINFEDERLLEFTINDFDLLLEAYRQLFNKKPIIFFDEPQNIQGWEKAGRRLSDTGYRVFITGSNATLISKEIASTLGGRFFTKEIQPLSFMEFLDFNNMRFGKNFEYEKQKIDIIRLQDDYLHYGGLPECLKYNDKRGYLSNIFQKVFYGDIITRYSIKNDMALKMLIKKIAESVNNEASFNRIKNIIQSANVKVGTGTLIEYFQYLEESFLIFSITNYTAKFSERENKKKFYFGDTGILNLFLIDQDSKLLENLVFIELKRRYQSEIYFYKRNIETDFYIPDKDLLIQVSYSIHDYNSREREIKALQNSMNEFNIGEAYIITYNEEEEINAKNKIIYAIPYWKWVLKSCF